MFRQPKTIRPRKRRADTVVFVCGGLASEIGHFQALGFPSLKNMRKHTRNRNYRCALDRQFLVFGPDTAQGWRVTRQISYADGVELVKAGKFRRVTSADGRLIGFQPIPRGFVDGDVKLPARLASCSAISARESMSNAGTAFAGGRSRTENMTEEQRLCRVHSKTGDLLGAEDAIERAVAKVNAWARPATRGGDRAVRVYPKVIL